MPSSRARTSWKEESESRRETRKKHFRLASERVKTAASKCVCVRVGRIQKPLVAVKAAAVAAGKKATALAGHEKPVSFPLGERKLLAGRVELSLAELARLAARSSRLAERASEQDRNDFQARKQTHAKLCEPFPGEFLANVKDFFEFILQWWCSWAAAAAAEVTCAILTWCRHETTNKARLSLEVGLKRQADRQADRQTDGSFRARSLAGRRARKWCRNIDRKA